MILDIVKKAVEIKITCQSESPLISEAEYCYAAAKALRDYAAPESLKKELQSAVRVEELRKKLTPYFRQKQETEEDPKGNRLLSLLIQCRVDGEITDEVRKIMDER